MNAPTTFASRPLPPTSNFLDARQRTRLIRSTRKLGAVLGTTPQLLEHESPAPSPPLLPIAGRSASPRKTSAYAKRRQGSVFELPPPTAAAFYDSGSSSDASSSGSSLSLSRSSLDSTTSVESTASLPPTKSFTRHVREKSRSKGKQTPLPTPLVLRLNAVPLPPSDPRLLQPVTPDTTATLSAYSRAGPMLPTTPTTPVTPTATETRRKRLAKLKRTLGENVPTELVLPFRSAASRQPAVSPTTPPGAPTTPRARTAPQATLPRPPPPPRVPGPRRRSMSVDFARGAAPLPTPEPAGMLSPPPERRSSRVWVVGNGTWTGEWNRRDIREVQSKLRTLRVR
ncbi:hypothetical protein C2E23DRAFT_872105 [Lenzites betulinus]|nr:hypothetical protein C2E23DRAFT_872105 [Lenzites betulinus]